ncbi:MAG: RidA family protein [Reyranellaceae bacterium]
MPSHDAVLARLQAAGLELPPAMPAVASYVPFVATETAAGTLVHVAGQGPFRDGRLEHVGRIGQEIDAEQARASARLVTLNVLAQAAAATQARFGEPALHRARCLRLGIFLNCVDGFAAMDEIADAASALVLAALAAKGRHCRSVVGQPVLPMRTSVEIDGLFLLDR